MKLRILLAKSQRYVRAFDWILAAASLGWGIYTSNAWWIAGGIIGFALAWIDPGTRLRRKFAMIKPGQAGIAQPASRRDGVS